MASRLVQSCITSVSFPDTLDGVLDMANKNHARKWLSDTDTLVGFDKLCPNGTFWTAPKWLTTDDILFFYHTKKAKQRVAKLLSEARKASGVPRQLNSLLERSLEFANRYSGTVFGCSVVSGTPEHFERDPELHFDSRCFAPISRVHIFENPLISEEFASHIRIGQSALTPIYRDQFFAVKNLLALSNELPEFLRDAEHGELSFQNVNATNWIEISCRADVRFITELQIREYFINYLLGELKDKGTSILSECRCYRRGKVTGYADYFVRIKEVWVPVEAKLNIMSEKDVLGQMNRYTRIDSFCPTLGTQRGTVFRTAPNTIALIVDHTGIFIVADGRFEGCDYNQPVWFREELTSKSAAGVRDRIISLMQA